MKRITILLVALFMVVGLLSTNVLAEQPSLTFGIQHGSPLDLSNCMALPSFKVYGGLHGFLYGLDLEGGLILYSRIQNRPFWGFYVRGAYQDLFGLESTTLFSSEPYWGVDFQYREIKAWISPICFGPMYVGAMASAMSCYYDVVLNYGPLVGISIPWGQAKLWGEVVQVNEYHPYWCCGNSTQWIANIGFRVSL